ncbi:MAG: hypothetical protein AAB582_00735 [Patescibacteria group bacterium]
MSRLLPIVAILIALGLFFGYINPTMSGPIAAVKQEIKSYESALEAADRFREKQQQLVEERAKIPPASIVLLESFLPNGADNVQLILDLDALASQAGLSLSEFTMAEPVEQVPVDGIVIPEETPVGSIELTTSGTGSYESFRAFLSAAESSLRPLDLVNLSIAANAAGAYTYDMTFRLYWLR